MPLSRQHRHAVLLAERTRDISTINTVVTEVLAANPETSLLDIETALHDADRQADSVANVTEVLAANPETSLLDIETALHDADRQADSVANVTEVLAANPETSLLDIETALHDADRQADSVANVTEALATNPKASLLDIETALRGAATSQAYLVANSTAAGFQIVFGTPAWHAALADAGLTVEQNWAALARRK